MGEGSKSISICSEINSFSNNHTSNTSFSVPLVFQSFSDDRKIHPLNFLFGYLNISSIRNKVIDLRVFLEAVDFNYLVLAETKISSEFPNAQFHISGYEIRNRRDRNSRGGGLIEYVKKGIICKTLKSFEGIANEIISSEITISNTKWLIVSIYRPPNGNAKSFFEELENILDSALKKYDNAIVMGDFNIDVNDQNNCNFSLLDNFCDCFSMSNLIKWPTCITKSSSSTIDLILTNRPNLFYLSKATEIGISDHHLLISSFT